MHKKLHDHLRETAEKDAVFRKRISEPIKRAANIRMRALESLRKDTSLVAYWAKTHGLGMEMFKVFSGIQDKIAEVSRPLANIIENILPYLAGDPEAWYKRGQQLEGAAQHLESRVEYDNVRAMLLVYSLEAYLKGAARASGHTRYYNHDLVDLVVQAELEWEVDKGCRSMLGLFENFSTWAGRYAEDKYFHEGRTSKAGRRLGEAPSPAFDQGNGIFVLRPEQEKYLASILLAARDNLRKKLQTRNGKVY